MRKILSYILLSLVAILTSCDALHEDIPDVELTGIPFGIIQGMVTDTENNIIEHIRVKINVSDGTTERSCYTSSEGKFRCEIPARMQDGQITFNILIEDIDGEENGGLYETVNDVITVFEEKGMKYPVIIDLPAYRLNHATASVNNRQS